MRNLYFSFEIGNKQMLQVHQTTSTVTVITELQVFFFEQLNYKSTTLVHYLMELQYVTELYGIPALCDVCGGKK